MSSSSRKLDFAAGLQESEADNSVLNGLNKHLQQPFEQDFSRFFDGGDEQRLQ